MATIAALVAECIDTVEAALPADGRYQDLPAWDSLAALTLVTLLEDEFGIVLGDGELKAASTLRALAALVERRQALAAN